MGSKVKLLDQEYDEELDYVIEADPFNNRISNESPVGSAILGKKKGATVEVNTPDGVATFKILAIS